MSRQSDYTEELAEQICERLANGESLRKICLDESMPSRSTVMRWEEENELFAAKCARARLWQGDYMDDLILEEAYACNQENFQAAKVRISAFQWRAAKLKPKKYGDKVTQEVTGPGGGPLLSLAASAKESAQAMREAADPNLAAQVYADLMTGRKRDTGT